MTVEEHTSFDLGRSSALRRSGTSRGLLALYADDVELIQIDRDNPPSRRACGAARRCSGGCSSTAPRRVSGRQWKNLVAGQERGAATITCEFPGGRKVVANSILEIEDGRIIRQRNVQAGDPKQ